MGKIKSTISYLKGPGPMFLTLWFIWILVGAVFYAFAPESNLGITKGFYQAINIGYSIGFGYPTESHEPYFYFSTMYVLVGSSFVAVALGFFAEKITEDQENWFTIMQQKKLYQEAFQDATQIRKQLKVLIVRNLAVVRSVGLWLVFLSLMIMYSMYNVEWSFTQAQYFAVTTLSTGGHWKIPDNSDTWLFGVTGLMTMFGVPITALAMAQVARALIDMGDIESTKEILSADVTAEELKMLVEFGLEDGDGVIDRSEFVILCMVRIGTDPELIHYISQRFDQMDTDGTGGIPIDRISKGNATFVDGKVRRTASVVGTSADATRLLQQLNNESGDMMSIAENSDAELRAGCANKVDYSKKGVSSRILMTFDFSDSSEIESEEDDDKSVKEEDLDLRGSLHQSLQNKGAAGSESSSDMVDGSELSYVNMDNYRGPLNHSFANNSMSASEDTTIKNPYISSTATIEEEDDDDESGDEFGGESEDDEQGEEYAEWADEQGEEGEDKLMDMDKNRASLRMDNLPNKLPTNVHSSSMIHSSTLSAVTMEESEDIEQRLSMHSQSGNFRVRESTRGFQLDNLPSNVRSSTLTSNVLRNSTLSQQELANSLQIQYDEFNANQSEEQDIEQRISMHSQSGNFRVRDSTRGFQLDNLPSNIRASALSSNVLRDSTLSQQELANSLQIQYDGPNANQSNAPQKEIFHDEDVDDDASIQSVEVEAEREKRNSVSSGFQLDNMPEGMAGVLTTQEMMHTSSLGMQTLEQCMDNSSSNNSVLPKIKSVMPAMEDSSRFDDNSNHLYLSPKELDAAQEVRRKREEEKIIEHESSSGQSTTSSRSSSTEKRDPESPLGDYDRTTAPARHPIVSNPVLTGDKMDTSFTEQTIGDLELESQLDSVKTTPRPGIGNKKIMGLVLGNKPNVTTNADKDVPYGGDSPSLQQGRTRVNEKKLNEDTKERSFTYRASSGGDEISFEVVECVRLDAEDSQRVNEFYFV